jgi:hypothetical protein
MIKLLAAASAVAIVAVGAAQAQTTSPSPSPSTPPAANEKATPPVQPGSPATPPEKMQKQGDDRTNAPGTTAQPSPSTQTPSATTKSASPSPGAGGASATLTLSDEDARNWIDKPVYSSDNQNLGEVAAFQRGADGKVQEMHADIGGFLGIGETRVRLMPSEFKLEGDRVVVNMTGEQAKALPKIEK